MECCPCDLVLVLETSNTIVLKEGKCNYNLEEI